VDLNSKKFSENTGNHPESYFAGDLAIIPVPGKAKIIYFHDPFCIPSTSCTLYRDRLD
jgi:hypothetical protein